MHRSRTSVRFSLLLTGALVSAVASSTAVEPLHAQAAEAYMDAVSEHFGVARSEVGILAGWGIDPDEIPVVLTLASAAGVSTDAVLALRRTGRSWTELSTRYSFSAARLYVPLPENGSLGPLARIYEQFRSRPSTAWSAIEVQDAEMVSLVNLRFLSEYLRVPPAEVLDQLVRSGSGVAALAALRRSSAPLGP